MFRYFAPITPAELKKKIEAFADDNGDFSFHILKEKLDGDLKVEFDLENVEQKGEMYGYKTLKDNGFTYFGVSAGGDWEFPVFFVVYWDGKKIRGYVPTDGNPWNTTTKQAFGNDDAEDLKNAKKRWPKEYAAVEHFDSSDFNFDWKAIKYDITQRIRPQKEKKVAVKKNSPVLGSLRDRIESLVYYGGPDEGSELFLETCRYCYNLNGLGLMEWANTICEWAEEMARETLEEKYESTDSQKGVWGR